MFQHQNICIKRIYKVLDNISNELIKLKTGKVLEIPKDIEEKLRPKDSPIDYGMLNKNGYLLQKNERIVENNSFIPYSFIMDSELPVKQI